MAVRLSYLRCQAPRASCTHQPPGIAALADIGHQVFDLFETCPFGNTHFGNGFRAVLRDLAQIVLQGARIDRAQIVFVDSSHNGQGAINREEKIELTVAAVIVDRLPNGNLVLAGRQEVRINGELRELTVSGIIRPEDVTANNRINHTQIAEARISYGGRGSISAVQRPNWGQRIGDAITPW